MRLILCLVLSMLAAAAAAEPGRDAQFARIDAAIAKMPPQVDGHTDVYFLGFAGDGEEKVFAEEIKLAAQRAGTKYGAADRSLLLINDRRDLASHPFATGTTLGYALQKIGHAMNRDEDVLILAFSSHGTRDAELIVENTGLPERGLAADDVALLLAKSGVRWRVVVVSACFSGLFIKPLAADESIVITAAAKNRSSFGCSDDRDLTYFGEAFWRDSIPGAPTLRAAVDAMKRAIRLREREERVTPSHPQAFFGAAMERKFQELEGDAKKKAGAGP